MTKKKAKKITDKHISHPLGEFVLHEEKKPIKWNVDINNPEYKRIADIVRNRLIDACEVIKKIK